MKSEVFDHLLTVKAIVSKSLPVSHTFTPPVGEDILS